MKRLSYLLCLALSMGLGSVPAPSAGGATQPARDEMLQSAREHPSAFMFTAATTSRADEGSYDLIITSARGVDGSPTTLLVPPGSMRVFRADADRDEFTKKGGWYWRIKDTQGKSSFSDPGALIMVVRDLDGTVHWYALFPDIRC